jgi:hypothetical protein
MQSDHRAHPNRVSKFISEMLKTFPKLVGYQRPPQDTDVLFQSDYEHDPDKDTCGDCDRGQVVNRTET